jgi:hypothetical protein
MDRASDSGPERAMTQDNTPGLGNHSDRRKHSVPLWDPRRLRGRRRRQRRSEEHDRPYLVDRVSWPAFVMSSLLLILTLVDGMITVALLDQGCEEANPVMRFLLDIGIGTFFIAKYVLTAIFLPIALVMNQHRLFGTRMRVGHVIPVVAALYVVLIAYQITLMRQWPVEMSVAASAGEDR